MQKSKDRFVVETKTTGDCDDPYCNGHEYSTLVDTKTGNSISLNYDLDEDVIIVINFFAECLEKEKHS